MGRDWLAWRGAAVVSDAAPTDLRYQVKRFVVDASAVLHLASAGIEVPGEHELLAPTLLRSQALSALHEAVQRGETPADVARGRLARIGRMPIRLFGDAVLRRRAWDLADQLGWAPTYNAEYVALAQLQAERRRAAVDGPNLDAIRLGHGSILRDGRRIVRWQRAPRPCAWRRTGSSRSARATWRSGSSSARIRSSAAVWSPRW